MGGLKETEQLGHNWKGLGYEMDFEDFEQQRVIGGRDKAVF